MSVTSHTGGTTDYILGDSDTAEITILDINQTSVLTFDAIITSEHADNTTGMTIDDNANIAAPDGITFARAVTVDTIAVGTAGQFGGNATFNGAVATTTIAIDGGDASEISTAAFNSTVTAKTDTDTSNTGNVQFTTGISGLAATMADGEGTVQITGSGITFTGAQSATGLQTLDVDATTSILNHNRLPSS